jgi:CheY-like chemotaxis protein
MNDTNKLRVLVVDDEADVRMVLRGFFEGRGCDVVTAEDGVEGLEAIDVQPFDAVVTDVQMPRRDGMWLWREAVGVRPELTGRFVFVSGYPSSTPDGGVERERFLPKPFTMSQLWAAVVSVTSVAP